MEHLSTTTERAGEHPMAADIQPSQAEDVVQRRSLLRRILGSTALWLLVFLLVASVYLAQWVERQGGPEAISERYGLMAPLVTLPLHTIVAVSPLPSDFLSIANGSLYGFWIGAILSWIGWWFAGLAAFAIGRRARHEFQLDSVTSRLPKWLQELPVGHPVYLIGARQIPLIGGDATTFVPGALGVSFRRYAWCSAVAIVPGACIMSAIGVGLLRL
jgi:uncharacterized membrane protein YdjX (TVP38/TMEM64 family)